MAEVCNCTKIGCQKKSGHTATVYRAAFVEEEQEQESLHCGPTVGVVEAKQNTVGCKRTLIRPGFESASQFVPLASSSLHSAARSCLFLTPSICAGTMSRSNRVHSLPALPPQ